MPAGKIPTLLLVDDNHDIHNYLSVFFVRRSVNVLSAYNGMEGLKFYDASPPDLIITDIEMPHMDGIEMIKKIRSYDQTIPVIVMTSHTDVDFLLKIIPLNISDYLIKPINLSKLEMLVDRFFSERKNSHIAVLAKQNGAVYNFREKCVYAESRRIVLTHSEIELLELLLENRHLIVEYEEIGEKLFGDRPYTINAIKCHIRNLRRKIPGIQIDILPKEGYILL